MSYNGYGLETQFGAYAMSQAEYLNNPAQGYGGLAPYAPRSNPHQPGAFGPAHMHPGNAYGDYGGDPLLTTAYGNSKRADTEQFQRLLVAAGFGAYLGSKGADGFFGAKTSDATKAYQASKGLSATGAADQATWDALRGTGAAAGAGAGTDPAKTASWQEGLGTFASGLAQGVAGMFTGGTAQAATGAGSMISPTTIGSSKKSMMPWVIGGVSILAVGGLVYYMSTKKGAGNRKGNRRGNGKGKGRSK